MPNTFEYVNGEFPLYYALLGIDATACIDDIQRAYRRAQLKHHPDKVGDDPEKLEICKALNRAKDVLYDSAARSEYDRQLGQELKRRVGVKLQNQDSQAADASHSKSNTGASHTNTSSKSAAPPPSEKAWPRTDENSSRPRTRTHPQHQPHLQTKPRPSPKPEPRSAPQPQRQPESPPSPPMNQFFCPPSPPPGSFWNDFNWTGGACSPDSDQHDYAQKQHFHSAPFNRGAGFGPERQHGQGSGFTTSSNAARSLPVGHSYITCCPCCGVASCPGALFVGRLASISIPCKSSFAFQKTVDSNFEAVNEKFADILPRPRASSHPRARLPNCTGQPDDCPQHQYESSAPYQESGINGNRDYIAAGRVPAYDHFAPPASMYPNHSGHNGTRPTSVGWKSARWKCFNLSDEHIRSVDLADHVCRIALSIQERMARLSNCLVKEFGSFQHAPIRSLSLASVGQDVQEIMLWCAASYKHIKTTIDLSVTLPANTAVPMLRASTEQLDILVSALTQTLIQISDIIEHVTPARRRDYNFRGSLRKIIDMWSQIVVLPPEIESSWAFGSFNESGHLPWSSAPRRLPYDVKPMELCKSRDQAPHSIDHCTRTWRLE